jgi:hypothetical protein
MIDIAFYTCYLGPDACWSNKVHSPPSREHSCYYFTNNLKTFDTAKAAGWIAVLDDHPIENNETHDCQNTKLLRCCPHLFEPLNKHAYLCYLDSKLWVTDLDRILSLTNDMTDEMPLVLSRHPSEYSSVWGEFDEAMRQSRYECHRTRYAHYVESMLRLGFRDVPLRHCCGFRIQKQCDLTRRVGEMWYAHIGLCGIEDQISWQFVVQKFPGAIHEIPYKSCWGAL